MNHKKGVTLIELMVVVIVLGILAVITVPNIKNIKGKAQISAALENKSTIQKGLDRYFLDKQELPVSTTPTKEIPAQIDWTKLVPPYIRSKPADLGKIFYWVDYNNTVWVSDVDAPTDVKLNPDGKTITWNAVSGAESYNVGFIEETANISKRKLAAGTGYRELQEINGATTYVSTIDLSNKVIVVSSVSKNFKSVPVGTGYKGANNHKPISVISMSPENALTTASSIIWGYENSTDEDGDSIQNAEWEGKQEIYTTAGTYLVRLRVQDTKGEWSDWVQKQIEISNSPYTPNIQGETNIVSGISLNDFDVNKVGSNFEITTNGARYLFNPKTKTYQSLTSIWNKSGVFDIAYEKDGTLWHSNETLSGGCYYTASAINNELNINYTTPSISTSSQTLCNIAVHPTMKRMTICARYQYDSTNTRYQEYEWDTSINSYKKIKDGINNSIYTNGEDICTGTPYYSKNGDLYIIYNLEPAYITYNARYLVIKYSNDSATCSYKFVYAGINRFMSDNPTTITEDSMGRLWIFSKDMGYNCTQSTNISYTIINGDSTTYKGPCKLYNTNSITPRMIKAVTDDEGNVWLFYSEGGKLKYVNFAK